MKIDYRSQIRTPKLVGTEVWILDGHGKLAGRYDAVRLAKDWLALGTEEFFKRHGFHWEPSDHAKEEARKLFM